MDVLVRRFAVIACIFLFAACSGSSSDPSASVEAPIVEPPLEPIIEFTDAGPLLLFTGETLDNPVIDSRCWVAYHSSDAAVVMVDTNTGQLVAIAPGTAEIRTTNSMGCDDKTVDLQVRQDEFSFASWIGEEDAEVYFEPSAMGYDFFRSRQSGCDLSAYAACDHGQFEPLTGVAVTDTAATLHHEAYYQLSFPEYTSRETPAWSTLPPNISGHAITFYKDRYWMVGGEDGGTGNTANIRSSADGLDWRWETDNPDFNPRRGHQLVVFNDRIWMLGGIRTNGDGNGAALTNELWSSEDGLAWQLEIPESVFPPRNKFHALVHDNRIWVIGESDVWSSPDGLSWTEESSSLPFTATAYYQRGIAAWKSRLWVVAEDRVWSSADGRAWVEEVLDAPFAARSGFELVVRAERLWLLPGGEGDDVWSSANGRNWRLEAADIHGNDSNYVALVHNDTFILVGGSRASWHQAPLVSKDGIKWQPYRKTGSIVPQWGAVAASFRDRLWLIGGYDVYDETSSTSNRIWSSADGLNWQQEASPQFAPRAAFALTVFNNQLWLIGGRDDALTVYDDVWRSDDGISWVKVEPEGETFAGRYNHSLTAWHGRMWLMGGYSSVAQYPDVWSSVDGVQWRRESEDIGIRLNFHRVVSRESGLYIVGTNPEMDASTAVLKSVNGVDWEILNQHAFPKRLDHAAGYFNDRFWVMGGCSSLFGIALADVWSSEDGISWQREPDFLGPERCLGMAYAVHNGEWFLIGGQHPYYYMEGSTLGTALDDVWKTDSGRSWRRAFHSSIKMR